MILHSALPGYVPEFRNFLQLFPHRSSYLVAAHPAIGEKPVWSTERKHPLSDRLIQQGAHLYGVRFGKQTNYLMIDLDASSSYHPASDPYAVHRILAAVEKIGLTQYIAITSSYSRGFHLYFPIYQPQLSWKLAKAAALLLESEGLRIQAGQLELFPNARGFGDELPEYNGHRLPLQAGSYLVDGDWQPRFTTHDEFCRLWELAEFQNSTTTELLDQVLTQYDRSRWQFLKGSALKFLHDLNADIEPGWTQPGQTNFLIGRIALREYVFFNVLSGSGSEEISLSRLCDRIVEVAVHLPGYDQFCSHKGEIEEKAFYWARSVQSSPKYYPYGSQGQNSADQPLDRPAISPNDQRAIEARGRIERAVAELLAAGELPQGTRNRLYALKAKGIGASTLYKHPDLWKEAESLEPASCGVILAIADEIPPAESLEPAPSGVILAIAPISFMCVADAPPQGGEPQSHSPDQGGEGGYPQGRLPLVGVEFMKQALDEIRQRRHQSLPQVATLPPDEAWFKSAHPRLTGSKAEILEFPILPQYESTD